MRTASPLHCVLLELLLVELEAQPRPFGEEQIAVLPDEGLDQDLVEEEARFVDALLDDEVGNARAGAPPP